jgi:hypothetical protein
MWHRTLWRRMRFGGNWPALHSPVQALPPALRSIRLNIAPWYVYLTLLLHERALVMPSVLVTVTRH